MCIWLQLQDAYAEVFRVLKPGSYFASYEWVSTRQYDPSNKDHVRIMDEINYGNGLPVGHVNIVAEHTTIFLAAAAVQHHSANANCSLHCIFGLTHLCMGCWCYILHQTAPNANIFVQEMRTYKQAEKAGTDCGFKLVLSYDVATASPVCGPW